MSYSYLNRASNTSMFIVKLRNQNVTMTNDLSANFTMQTIILYTQAKYLYTRILYGNKLFTIY